MSNRLLRAWFSGRRGPVRPVGPVGPVGPQDVLSL